MSSPNDLEMNDVKSPLMSDGGDIPAVEIKGSKQSLCDKKIENEFHGLTKEELEKFANDPFWKKLRLILFILFWIVWVGMLIAAILIVVFSPKCPKRPKLEFWEQKAGYLLDPFAYVDTDKNGVGDFQGIISKLNYIQKEVGAGYIILQSPFKGQYETNKKIGSVQNFKELDTKLGTQESLLQLIKEARKLGIEVVLSADFNSLAMDSALFKDEKEKWLVVRKNEMLNWKNREGKQYEGEFYSVFPEMFDLNLQSPTVLKEIKESVKLWLESGVRGFLLTNVPFYVENSTIPQISTNHKTSKTWYDNQALSGQIYSSETKAFLMEIRKTMDEIAKSTDKSRLLIVEAGDIGFGLNDAEDQMLQYLGDDEKLADMIMGREFLHNRGWKIDGFFNDSCVKKYMDMVPEGKQTRVALTSATSTNIRTTDLLKLASPFLVRGNPIIYYGSEIGLGCETVESSSEFYPGSAKFPQYNDSSSSKCNHMIMPWDNTGEGFFNGQANITDPFVTNSKITVQKMTAVGVGETILTLTKKLIDLRKLPSLLWGKMSMIKHYKTEKSFYEIFTREAEGFPKIIVALLKDSEISGKVFSFKSTCEKLSPILVYPSNSNLELKKEVDSSKIYLQMYKTGSIHVFQCS